MNIDYNRLRSDLIDYLGTAINYHPNVVVELSEIERASDEELIRYAKRYGFDLNNYVKGTKYIRYRI